ncbi:MAG: hypothetical protein INF79_03435 [Roseomonas sp.]|nr:hypothetical protein [Roseomonas sp.]MCA3364654.1 hypothetical protein [Roseomonas sp.]MCA3381455.1 hypothetical protein [Roseomonas sp.]
MLNLAIAPIGQDYMPQPAPAVWVTWAEGIAGPATLAPRGEFRCFLVFALAGSAAVAARKAEMTLRRLGWHHVATQIGARLDPERLHSLPDEFHEICEAAMGGQTGIMHYRVNRRLMTRFSPLI